MSSDRALYERDPEAWNAYLAEGNAKQARKRVSADVIIRDGPGRILLVDPKYKPDWDLPGGMAEANEPPAAAARRELREELGFDLQPGGLLCVDWVSPHGPWDDLISFIFDGGVLDDTALRPCGSWTTNCAHTSSARWSRSRNACAPTSGAGSAWRWKHWLPARHGISKTDTRATLRPYA